MDNLMRLVLGTALLAALYLGWQMRNGRSGRGNLFDRRGLTVMRTILVALLGLALAWYVITPTAPVLMRTSFPDGVRIFGFVSFAVGFVVRVWAQYVLGKEWSADLSTRENHRLVTSGPYTWTSHPIYHSYVLIAPGLLLSTQNWLIGSIAIIYAVVSLMRTEEEVRMLTDKFGVAYIQYVDSTRTCQRTFVRCVVVSIFVSCHIVGMVWELRTIIG